MSLPFKAEISFKFGLAQELWGSEYQAAPAVVVFIGVQNFPTLVLSSLKRASQ